jgi:hypothetical protein
MKLNESNVVFVNFHMRIHSTDFVFVLEIEKRKFVRRMSDTHSRTRTTTRTRRRTRTKAMAGNRGIGSV